MARKVSKKRVIRLINQEAQREGVEEYAPYLAAQIEQESGFQTNLGSPAGARDIAQFMPETAKSYGVTLGDNRIKDDIRGQVKMMAQLIKQTGNIEDALRGYNAGPGAIEASKGYAETNHYVDVITQNSKKYKAAPSAATPNRQSSNQYGAPSSESTPGVDNSAQRQQLQQGYLLDRGKPDALLQLAYGLSNAQDVAPTTTLVPGQQPSRNNQRNPGGPGDPYNGKVTLAPGADRPGAPTHKRILRFIKDVSDRANEPLTIGTGTNHSQYSVSGNVSDHWVGRGADVPAAGQELVKLGRKALIAAGMPKAEARKQTGGLFNVNGYQIIFNTQEGGDHTDHLHVGYRQGR